MEEAEITALDALLTAGYALTHITGYEQPKAEWFGVMRSGAFNYHHITLNDRYTTIDVMGEQATISGRGIFNATINGLHSPWRLQFVTEWVREKGQWKMRHATYRSY